MIVITHRDIEELNIPLITCYNWAKELISNKNEVILPPKISIKPEEGVFYNVMPSFSKTLNFAGLKMVNRYPKRIPALDSKILLYDQTSGECLALIDGNWITAVRTGAVAAYTINHYAKSGYQSIGIMGLGNTARSTLNMLLTTNTKLPTINLLKYKNQEKLFEEYYKKSNLIFNEYEDVDELVSNSDVVISCVTYASHDFCQDSSFKKGVLVVPVHTLGFTNCDLFFDQVIVDDIGHVNNFKNFDKFKEIHELTELYSVTNKRKNDKERIIAYNIGISAQDMYFAKKIYDLCKDRTLQNAVLYEPHQKYWI